MIPLLVIITLAAAAVLLRKLTPAAGVAGALVAGCMYAGMGWAGLALLGTFFVGGTAATSLKSNWKKEQGLKEANGGRRRPVQVLANGGMAAATSFGAFCCDWYQHGECMPDHRYAVFLRILSAAALSSATADTLASELGNVYGSRYFDLRTGKTGVRGNDGVISLEGTAAGVAGSILIALIFYFGVAAKPSWVLAIIIAGTCGNLVDSWLGATLQRKGYLTNDGVNFWNTAAASIVAAILVLIVSNM